MSRIALALLILQFTACAGHSPRDSKHDAPQPPGMALAPPSQFRATSFIPGERSLDAAQYETLLPSSGIAVNGTALEFFAQAQVVDMADLAFATYALDITGYGGAGLLSVDWQGGAPAFGVWLGLANWADDRWDWQLTPVAEEIDLGLYGDYVNGVDGRMLVTILSTRNQTLTLDTVAFGTPGLEPPLNVVASDGTFTDKVQLTWDPPGSGPAPTGYTIWRSATQAGSYSEIGSSGTTTYDDTAIVVDTTYWYKVKSTKNAEPDSSFSNANDGFATAGGAGWTITTAATWSGQEPQHLSLALVNGNPAVIYNRSVSGYGQFYTRAQDTAGSVWGVAPLEVEDTTQEPSLGYLGGRPGYCSVTGAGSGNLFYRHGSNADGDMAWDAAALVFDAESAHVCSDPDLLNVGGNPAIAFKYSDFLNSTGTELCYMRATNAIGDAWPATRVVVDSGDKAWNPQLVILPSGNPAILYNETDLDSVDDSRIMYVRAINATGSAWQLPEEVYEFAGVNTLSQLQIVIADGRPAAFFMDGTTLYYKRADDANGDSWPAGATVRASNADFYDGATTVNGLPAAAYVVSNAGTHTLMYLQAIDAAGNSWLPADPVESGPTPLDLVTLKAFGNPTEHACIAYRADSGEIRFARKN